MKLTREDKKFLKKIGKLTPNGYPYKFKLTCFPEIHNRDYGIGTVYHNAFSWKSNEQIYYIYFRLLFCSPGKDVIDSLNKELCSTIRPVYNDFQDSIYSKILGEYRVAIQGLLDALNEVKGTESSHLLQSEMRLLITHIINEVDSELTKKSEGFLRTIETADLTVKKRDADIVAAARALREVATSNKEGAQNEEN